MLVTLEEMKNYLRVDDDEDDGLITTLLASAERMCMDILRTDEESGLQLNLTLRALLFGSRKEAF